MGPPSETELAWAIVEHATTHLTFRKRSEICMHIGAGDARLAIEIVLKSYVAAQRVLPGYLAAGAHAWIACYSGNVDEPRIRRLIHDATSTPATSEEH
ncbi:hypothetical protein SAMN02799620_05583 [Mycolicibacterium fluoranthenivorans]|jgi:hypothetical protein|uniref:Uncharacterized protein n=2 Tax=Mycolicibacterium fluoranthenivorans TaxID=258505 RepID=A0A1G4X089_9MYCO|nr:hypothetical protein SAMN02799620_05583 [Mycolicibacterium fluoranthenivorans]